MANINRISSPMDVLDEGLGEPPDKVTSRQQFLREKQRTKSPFLIGSIEEMNMRISQLDQKLHNYMGLVCESPASGADNIQLTPKNSRESEQFHNRERDKKEVCQFAGIYTLKSTFLPNLSSRAKNISKISIVPNEYRPAVVSKEEAGKPKFVELHLYPGFDPQELTPLPGGFEPDDILRKVVEASVYLSKKLGYKQKFEQLFFSQLSQAMLLDTFWYVFLHKFQPDAACQQKLFDRVAHNYVSLLLNSSDTATKDIFFKAYPRLMSQAVYSSFCHSFPDSYRQFGELFRDDLVNLVYAWMAGIRPLPRSWMTWKMASLEPPSLKQREDMMNRKNNKKGKPLFGLDSFDLLVSTSASLDASTRSLSTSLSTAKSSTGSVKTVTISQVHDGISKVKRKPVSHLYSCDKSHLPASTRDIASMKSEGHLAAGVSLKHGKDVARASKSLSTIREVALDDGGSDLQQKSSHSSEPKHRHKAQIQDLQGNVEKVLGPQLANSVKLSQSHPVGRSCDYVQAVFDVHGQSPLVEHVLRLQAVNPRAGQLVWVHRLELDNLPPLDAPTYRDIITSSSRSVGHMKMAFLEQRRNNVKVTRARLRECKSHLREHVRRQTSLLANEKEVKKLSDLIIMEQRRDKDSVTAGADAALTASMSEH